MFDKFSSSKYGRVSEKILLRATKRSASQKPTQLAAIKEAPQPSMQQMHTQRQTPS